MYTLVLAFDPGGTTGWAMGKITDTEPMTFVAGGQIANGVDGFVAWFHQVPSLKLAGIIEAADKVVIVSESFQLRPGVKSPDLTPLRIEGALTALVGSNVVVYQPPARKALVPDQRLRINGLWEPGQRHHMDARIHALSYALTIGHKPTLEAYWSDTWAN